MRLCTRITPATGTGAVDPYLEEPYSYCCKKDAQFFIVVDRNVLLDLVPVHVQAPPLLVICRCEQIAFLGY